LTFDLDTGQGEPSSQIPTCSSDVVSFDTHTEQTDCTTRTTQWSVRSLIHLIIIYFAQHITNNATAAAAYTEPDSKAHIKHQLLPET